MRRTDGAAAAVLGLAYCVWAVLVGRLWFVADDAYITYRYSRNWALGRGILYNIGESPVEGYSNFSWMAIGALVEWLRLPIDVVMPALSAAAGAALLGCVFFALRRHLELAPLGAALGVLALAASPPFAMWSTSGLETMPFALLLFVAFERLALARDVVGASIAGVLLCLVRTEGPAWAGVVAGAAVVGALLDRRSVRHVAVFAAVLAAAYLPYFGWRYVHFGTLVANTTLAKVGFGAYALGVGGRYVVSFWLAMLAPGAFLLALPVIRRRPSVGAPIALLALAVPAFAVAVGGDYMPMGRMLVPGLPFAVLLAVWAVSDAGRPRPAAAAVFLAVVAVGVLPAFDVNPVPTSIRAPFAFRAGGRKVRSEYAAWVASRTHVEKWIPLGLAMRQVAKPGDTWVTGGIGALGYFSDVFIYDVGGIVNREVASRPWSDREARGRSPGHEKVVPSVFFLDRQPTFLRAELVQGDDWAEGIAREVARWKVSPAVARLYVPEFREVAPYEGRRQFAVLLRRVRPGEDPEAVWADLGERLVRHARAAEDGRWPARRDPPPRQWQDRY